MGEVAGSWGGQGTHRKWDRGLPCPTRQCCALKMGHAKKGETGLLVHMSMRGRRIERGTYSDCMSPSADEGRDGSGVLGWCRELGTVVDMATGGRVVVSSVVVASKHLRDGGRAVATAVASCSGLRQD